jgi:ATP-dependent DNA helicase RecG
MDASKVRLLLAEGEDLTVEFKQASNGIHSDVYESVCSFSNRYGGYILLGVEDDGTVLGVNRNAAPDMKKNFISQINNSSFIAPTLFLELEEVELDGKLILAVYVPANSQVVLFKNQVFDRVGDSDVNITGNTTLVANLHLRKSADYTERKIFPFATEDDLRLDELMPRVRRMAADGREDHPWLLMSDKEIVKSAGLYEKDRISGVEGFNLAAILLLGTDEAIQSCAPGYITDAILRRENLDRYDDRLMVTTNLIESYDLLMGFIEKHTLDRFYIIDGLRTSIRSLIAREIVSNVLMHREFSSAFPAKIIIEHDRIVTENWTRSRHPGKIDPDNFTPYPRNPIIARFFMNIRRADQLGSGMRNLYRFTKMYSGQEPELIDGDVFKTIVPLEPAEGYIRDKHGNIVKNNNSRTRNSTDKVTDKVTDKPPRGKKEFLILLNEGFAEGQWFTNADVRTLVNVTEESAKRYLRILVKEGNLKARGENKSRAYCLRNNGD